MVKIKYYSLVVMFKLIAYGVVLLFIMNNYKINEDNMECMKECMKGSFNPELCFRGCFNNK